MTMKHSPMFDSLEDAPNAAAGALVDLNQPENDDGELLDGINAAIDAAPDKRLIAAAALAKVQP